jgi:hypothetical protein
MRVEQQLRGLESSVSKLDTRNLKSEKAKDGEAGIRVRGGIEERPNQPLKTTEERRPHNLHIRKRLATLYDGVQNKR